MQTTFAFSNKNDKNDKSLVNDGNSLDNNKVIINGDETSDYSNIRMTNYTETLDTAPNNNNDLPNFGIMSQHNRVLYFVDVARKARFLSSSLKTNGLHVVRSIMYKPELKKIQYLLRKDEQVHLYNAKYARNIVSKEILLIRKFQSLKLESSQLSS